MRLLIWLRAVALPSIMMLIRSVPRMPSFE
jgi:hypothetical protein